MISLMQQKRLRVSVVIPAYNEGQHLDACLAAIAKQTRMPDEVIVVDNNSTDNTAAIATSYPFVRLIHEKHQGLRAARNAGMDAATGDIVGRIDADAIMQADWCEWALKLFADRNVQGATGPCYYYDFPAHRTSLRLDRFCRKLAFSKGEPILYGSNMVLRKTAWQHIRSHICMEGTFYEDCDISIHMHEANYRTVYNDHLVVGIAARRLDDNPKQFYDTMCQFDRTYAIHGQRSPTAQWAKYMFLAGYPSLKVMRAAYNPDTKQFSLRHLIRSRTQARPTSNT
jgi:glycosyltransferase involved in cell wall biosynthesis